MLNVSLKKSMPYMVLIAVSFLVPSFFHFIGFTYGILIGTFVLLYIIAVSGLDIVFGYSGQISIGHAAFFAIGAYGSGIMHNSFGIPVIFTMFIGASMAAFIGALLAYPASKLIFHFLALATVAFGEIVFQIITQSPGGITGDVNGMFSSNISIFGIVLFNSTRRYYFGLVCVIVFLLAKDIIIKSKIGRAFIAIRENTRAADGMGVNVRKYKIMAFSISAFYTAFAGGLFMHFVLFISPETFMLRQSIMFITMLMLGGTASLFGPVVGVIVVTLLAELLRPLAQFQMLIHGALMLLVILVIPGGVWGASVNLWKHLKRKFARKGGLTDA